MAKLTLQFVPYMEIERLKTSERIKKLLKIILDNKVIILQGRLKAEEEARLIEDTMAMVGRVRNFKGVELAVLSPKQRSNFSFKSSMAKLLLPERDAMTVIGPASIVKDIKRDPGKMEIFLK